MRIGTTMLAGAMPTLVLLAISALADDDTLRDFGPAAPGEIPKWDGAQWRSTHDGVAGQANVGGRTSW